MPFPPANANDAAALADELVRYRVVGADRVGALAGKFPDGTGAALVEFLVERGELTPFQAARVLAGEAAVLALGPYRLTGHAGRGTFGPLYAAAHTSKPDAFVLRVTPLRSLWKARQAKQLARTLAAGAPHPQVVPLLEVDSANGFHYMVWPRTEGVRLAESVEADGPLPPGDAVALLGHLANALAACHARGVVHAALTPDCVCLPEHGLPRLLELGAGALLAQSLADDEALLDTLSTAFASAGVLAFGAPEQALSPLDLTPACDQYALGAVGYFALTGLLPYPHPTLAEQLRAKRVDAPPSVAVVNPDVPHELAAVLERMMAPDPRARFGSLAEVEQRLAALNVPTAVAASEPVALESLLLSRLQRGGAVGSGAISWAETGSGVLRPAARDDSDASITFDLPDVPAAPETVSGAFPVAHELADTPRAGRGVTVTSALSPVSPVPSGEPVMGNRLLGAMNDGSRERPPLPPPPPDPRLSAPTPVQWHTADDAAPGAARRGGPPKSDPGAPPAGSAVLKKLRRNVLFWQAARDPVQVTVFGPAAATPGQTIRLTIFLHTPDAAANVRTLSRAFQHDAEQIGTGYLAREVPRAAELAVHVSVANAGVSKALMTFVWRGQPHKLNLDLHVPWESAEGWTPGLVSVGLDDVRVGKIEFWLNVLPRKA